MKEWGAHEIKKLLVFLMNFMYKTVFFFQSMTIDAQLKSHKTSLSFPFVNNKKARIIMHTKTCKIMQCFLRKNAIIKRFFYPDNMIGM